MKKVVGMLAVVGLCVLAYWFWPGEEPILPKPSEVRDIRLVQGQEVVQIDQSEEIAVFLAELGNAKKTHQDSVHDAPLVSPHVRIAFVMAEGETTAFAYEGILNSYLEFPYIGIYKLKESPQVIQKMLAD
ncbi:DUF5301 domain-containing protein [Streptococcus parasuis]|uniref:DUF5301 domain-containing protein n=1 Tax=Streptococcus parasuis TaxID=1501662 RepID=A0ABV2ET84_9STRE|nr:DUF5301 domain-containing protein [Streptococcus parasuis]BCP58966.1 hypothetical protein SUT286_02920 [Streptococcus parasuis]